MHVVVCASHFRRHGVWTEFDKQPFHKNVCIVLQSVKSWDTLIIGLPWRACPPLQLYQRLIAICRDWRHVDLDVFVFQFLCLFCCLIFETELTIRNHHDSTLCLGPPSLRQDCVCCGECLCHVRESTLPLGVCDF